MKAAFIVYVDLNETPGPMYSRESAQNVIRFALENAIGEFNPTISLAPDSFQPYKAEGNIEE